MGRRAGTGQCHPQDIRRIFVKPDGLLVADLADGSGATASELVLAGPLGQQDADWLEDALRQVLGLRDWMCFCLFNWNGGVEPESSVNRSG